ncbi:MAG: cysteine hydrolase family protein [Actinomycetota bacterium]
MPDRPSPRATGGETALVVIDVQHSYFEHPALAAQQAELTAAVVELLRTAREAGRPVFLVRTEHARDRSTWTLNMLADGEGFAFPGTRQAAVLEEVAQAAEGGVEVVKTRDSAFHRTDLEAVLRERGVERILLCGVSTHSCVAQTATAAFALDFHAAIATDAIASEEPALAAAMLDFLRDEMRQPLLGQDEALTLLRTGLVPDRG